jgi:predicted transcriptional regulator
MKITEEVSKLEKLMMWSVAPQTSTEYAVSHITDKQLEALLVLEGGSLYGIILDSSFKKVRLTGKPFSETQISRIIDSIIITASSKDTVARCLELTKEKKARYLPILVDGKLVGIVSMEELAREMLSEPED